MKWQSFFCSIGWLSSGAVFGYASILMVLASSAIFKEPVDLGKVIDSNFIVFLCIALMSGAGTDFLISGHFMHLAWRIVWLLVVIILLLIAYFLFNPNNLYKLDKEPLVYVEIGYIIITICYCLTLKSLLIYRERVNHIKAQHL